MYGESAKDGEESDTPPVDAEVCRICRQTAEESGEALEHAGCHCTGSMSLCHRACLEKWMVYQRSRVCELCHGLFQFELDDSKVSENIQKELLLARHRHAVGCRSRRIWFLVCAFTLTVTASVSACLSVYAIRFDDSLASEETTTTTTDPTSNWTTTPGVDDNHPQVFCIVVTVWLFALVVVVLSLWIFVELVLWPREAMLTVNITWFAILHEVYERLIAAEQGNIRSVLLASSREAAASAAAAPTPTAVTPTAASPITASPKNSSTKETSPQPSA